MRSMASRLQWSSALVWALTLAMASSAAGAATTSYPPNQAARDFGASQAGWTESSSFDGTCVPPLLCPSLTNSFQPSGGAADDGFIRSSFVGVLGAGGTSTGTWQSPPFTYTGASGQPATSISFRMSRRADVSGLLAVAGNAATYSVELLDLTAGGPPIPVVGAATLGGAGTWSTIAPVAVSPADLAGGHKYSIRIASSYSAGASALVTGSADYDNVLLRAERGNGQSSSAGGRAGDDGRLSWGELLAILLRRSPRTAVLRGKRLFVKVNCPVKVGRSCRIRAQAFLRKGKPATNIRTVKVGKGKGRRIVLRVRPKLRRRIAKMKRILVRQKVRAGRVNVYFWKVRKLIRRR